RNGTDAETLRLIQDGLVARARALPGVRTVGASSEIPVQGVGEPHYIVTVPTTPRRRVAAYGAHVDSDYFAVLRTTVVAGRVFDGSERPNGPRVAVVSVSFARKAFGDTNIVGREVIWHGPRTIVGVVEDQGFGRGLGEPRPAIFIARSQEPVMRFCLFVEIFDSRVAPTVLRHLGRLDPNQPLDTAMSLPAVLELAFQRQRSYAFSARVLAAVGSVMGLVGLLVAVGWFVASRERGITIRMVLGATTGRIMAYVMGSYAARLWPALVVSIPVAAWLCWRIEETAAPLRMPVVGSLLASAAGTVLACLAIGAAIVRRRTRGSLVIRD
ncbi:MAG: ABC transporter permease, partial [Vicinamibacterales bacterium]|nr:ABC transporter permease [Vicinamibacterales bacterium]